MAGRVNPAISRKILEAVRANGGSVTIRDMQAFKQLVGVDCSMNVFKREVSHLAGPKGKLVIGKVGRHDQDSPEGGLIIRLAKALTV